VLLRELRPQHVHPYRIYGRVRPGADQPFFGLVQFVSDALPVSGSFLAAAAAQ
jgi:hypothetical protein